MRLATALSISIVCGCAFSDVDLSGKTGPCAEGWTGSNGQVCEEGDAGTKDVSVDAKKDLAVDDVLVDAALDRSIDAELDEGVDADQGIDVVEDMVADIRPDGPIPMDCDPNVLFCDDFETVDQPEWTKIEGPSVQALATFTDDQPRTGNTSLKAEIINEVITPFGPHYFHDFPAFRATKLYVRAFVYLSDDPYLNINLFGFAPTDRRAGYLDIKIRGNRLGTFFGSPATYSDGNDLLPPEEWICISVEVDVADAGKVVVEAKSFAGIARLEALGDTEPNEGLERFYIGPYWSTPRQPTGEYWIDDVSIDTNPLPCP